MNQILATSQITSGKKNKGPLEIGIVIKFFIITLIVMGILMIGSGSYAIYSERKQRSNIPTKPTIVEEKKGTDAILLKIMHDKAIDKVEYYWNDEESEIINGNGRKYIEQEIAIPGGKNTLHVRATDVNGQTIDSQVAYEAPEIINVEVSGSKLKITADYNKTISYMTYRWNEEDEIREEINSNTVDLEVDIPVGENTITIILVDENNKTIEKVQKVKGVTIPKIEVSIDDAQNPENFVIKATDDTGLDRIEFTINNGQKYRLRALNNETKLEYVFKLEPGENYIEAIAYNKEGIESKVFKAKATK